MFRLRGLQEVETGTAPIAHFRALLDAEESTELESTLHALANAMQGRRLWNVNSTARGGGVAEMLAALIPYGRDAGIDERWVVIEGSPAFFAMTKKLHTLLHGVRPDGSDLSDSERREYERALAPNAEALLEEVRPGDVAILHDPQTAGLAPTLREHGVRVVWRSHIGVDEPNASCARRGRSFALSSPAPTPSSSPGRRTCGKVSNGRGSRSSRPALTRLRRRTATWTATRSTRSWSGPRCQTRHEWCCRSRAGTG